MSTFRHEGNAKITNFHTLNATLKLVVSGGMIHEFVVIIIITAKNSIIFTNDYIFIVI